MSGLLRIFLPLLVPCLPVFAQPLVLPPLTGEISGRMEWRKLAGAAPVDWRLTLLSPADGPGALRLQLVLTAPGLAAQVEVLPTAGIWRVMDGEIDLTLWLRPLAAAMALELPSDLEGSGRLRVAGGGTWRGGRPEGRLTVDLTEGRLAGGGGAWQAAPVALSATVGLAEGDPRLQSARLTIAAASGFGLTLEQLELTATGMDDGRVQVAQATARALGGRMTLAPFVFDPAAPAVTSSLELEGLDLAELTHLLPTALSEASGRINGQVGFDWNLAGGARAGRGELTVSADTPAALRLAPAPGFLTERVPARIQLLPAWLGPLARWLAPENPAHGTLSDIELGRQPLQVEQLRVELRPDGPDGARSATVMVAARPVVGGAVERVTFTINVSGPLDQVVRLGLDDRARLNFRSGR